MDVLWCVTGAGHFLGESFAYMKRLAREGCSVTVVFSRAGFEVSRMYGLFGEIVEEFPVFVLEDSQGASSPLVGRLAKREYGRIVVAPCTANTVAKIVCGIADSLVSNVVAQAGKCGIPVDVLPTDLKRLQKTRTPLNIDYEKCAACPGCAALDACPSAVFFVSDRVRLDLLRCDGCLKCVDACPYGAVEFGREVTIECRELDVANVERLAGIWGVRVLKPADLER